MPRILVPLPDRDFDVTEVAVPWKLVTGAGHQVVFATEEGAKPAADPRILDGVVFGQLGAHDEPKAFYRELETDAAFTAPIALERDRARRLRRVAASRRPRSGHAAVPGQ
jgi:hypothetical protein